MMKRKWIIGAAGAAALFVIAFPPHSTSYNPDLGFILSTTNTIEYGQLLFALLGIAGAAALAMYLFPEKPSDPTKTP